MSHSLTLTASRDLLHAARDGVDVQHLHPKFLASYYELEAAKLPRLGPVVALAFEGLDHSKPLVHLFRDASGEVAEYIDSGKDGTKKNRYHNPLHFAKTDIFFRAFTLMYNAAHPDKPLSDVAIAGGIWAATSHDFGHDGKGNGIGSQHQQFRGEQNSIDLAMQIVARRSYQERIILREALAPIYGTDVSRSSPFKSPMLYVRDLYDIQNGAPIELVTTPYSATIHQGLKTETDILIAAMLQTGDIFASVLDWKINQIETKRIQDEIFYATGQRLSQKELRHSFFNVILEGRVTLDLVRPMADDFIQKQMAKHRPALVLA